MRVLLYNFFILLIGCTGTRTLDQSREIKPDWLHGIEKDKIIVTGFGVNHDLAKKNAILKIRREIVNSVSVYVKSEAQLITFSETDGFDTRINDNYIEKIISESAFLVSLNGISLNKAEAYYWEKVKEKDQISIKYHIKYPFSNQKLNLLISQWQKVEQKIDYEYEILIVKISKNRKLENFEILLNELKYFKDVFFGLKKKKVSAFINKYIEKIKSIRIHKKKVSTGSIRYNFLLGNEYYYTDIMPNIVSDCVREVTYKREKYDHIVSYRYSECNNPNANHIEFSHTINGHRKSEKVLIKYIKKFLRLAVAQSISIINYSDGSYFCHIVINSENMKKIYIERVQLKITRYGTQYGGIKFKEQLPILVLPVKKILKGNAKHLLKFRVRDSELDSRYSTDYSRIFSIYNIISSLNHPNAQFYKHLVSGSIFYEVNNISKELKFSNLEYSTNW
jgi:hypothetical protein